MEKLTKEAVAQLRVKETRTKHPNSIELEKLMATLAVEESVLVRKSEWHNNNGPAVGRTQLRNKDILPYAKFSRRSLLDESGWVITRVA